MVTNLIMAKIILLANLRVMICIVSLKYLMAHFMHSAGKGRPMASPINLKRLT
jgi:hypothetical protein